jgi:hypothetical protein
MLHWLQPRDVIAARVSVHCRLRCLAKIELLRRLQHHLDAINTLGGLPLDHGEVAREVFVYRPGQMLQDVCLTLGLRESRQRLLRCDAGLPYFPVLGMWIRLRVAGVVGCLGVVGRRVDRVDGVNTSVAVHSFKQSQTMEKNNERKRNKQKNTSTIDMYICFNEEARISLTK